MTSPETSPVPPVLAPNEPPSAAPLVGVLALQGDVAEHVRLLQALGVRVRTVRRRRELEGLDGLVLPGGESTTMEKLARAFGLFELLREAIADGLPTMGTCAGMVLLADGLIDAAPGQGTLGGVDVRVRRNAFGRQVDSFESTVRVEDAAGGFDFPATFIRAPWVEEIGEGVEVVARVAPGHLAAGKIVAVRQRHVFAMSFHPEVTGDPRIHRMFVETLRQAPARS